MFTVAMNTGSRILKPHLLNSVAIFQESGSNCTGIGRILSKLSRCILLLRVDRYTNNILDGQPIRIVSFYQATKCRNKSNVA